MATATAPSWHIAKWGFLGWLETGLKAIGIIAGLIALTQTVATGSIEIAGVGHGLTLVLLAIATLVTLIVFVFRITQREIISIIYALFNALGHLAMLYHVVNTPDSTILPIVFGISYVLGELVKQRFLVTSGYTEMGQGTAQMVMASRGIMISYALIAIASIL